MRAKKKLTKRVGVFAQGLANNIKIAIDMTQNLAIPSQSIEDVLRFVDEIGYTEQIAFIEEAFGPDSAEDFPQLRAKTTIPVAGGEIVTTFRELQGRIEAGYYDIAQPDVTVIGGIQPTIDLFQVAQASNTTIYVHCWGGPVGMMANYHAAIVGGGQVAEWPMPQFELRNALLKESWGH